MKKHKKRCMAWLSVGLIMLGLAGCGQSTVTDDGSKAREEGSTEASLAETPESSYDIVEKAWLSLLEHEIITLGDSGEVWDGAEDRTYRCSYGIYGGEEMKIVDADVLITMNGDLLRVNEEHYSTRRNAADFLLQTALRRAGELYLEQAELLYSENDRAESIKFCLYVLEMEPDETEPMGMVVIATEGMVPMELTIGGMMLSHLDEYTANTSSERIYEGKTEALKSVLTVKVELSMDETDLWTNIDRGELADKEDAPDRLAYGQFFEGKVRYYDGGVNYPVLDYDGDGTTDRVFKSEKGNVYLMLSSGEKIYLNQQISPDQGGWLELVDMNGDNVPETVYIRRHWSSAGSPHYIQMWERTENGLEDFPFVYASEESFRLSTQIRIPLILEKLDDTHMKITQPECGISVVQEFVPDEFDHWGFEEGDYGPIDSEVYCDHIMILNDPQTGKTTLRMYGCVGDKWSSIYVTWEMSYENGVWKVTAFKNGRG